MAYDKYYYDNPKFKDNDRKWDYFYSDLIDDELAEAEMELKQKKQELEELKAEYRKFLDKENQLEARLKKLVNTSKLLFSIMVTSSVYLFLFISSFIFWHYLVGIQYLPFCVGISIANAITVADTLFSRIWYKEEVG